MTLAFAFLLDLLVGDPVYRFHPVRLMGRMIERSESFLRRPITHEKAAGAVLAVVFPAFIFFLAWSFIFLLGKIHFLLGWTASIFGIYSAISVRDLYKEGVQIYKDLEAKDIESARRDLARIVGRDTHFLNEEEILRASIETIAESTLDGIVAPLFYAALGGAPLALAYKAVNTLDSMIGHLNKRYRNFGFASAKQDELWNWIPARLSFFAIVLAVPFVKGRLKETLVIGWKDGMRAGHGNGTIPEAVFAGALGLKLGGMNFYEGRTVHKPFLGVSAENFQTKHLLGSLKLMMTSSWIVLIGSLVLNYGIGFLD